VQSLGSVDHESDVLSLGYRACISAVEYKTQTRSGARTFRVAGPTSWNSLPDRLRDPTLSADSFRGNNSKRGIICAFLNTLSAVEMLRDSALCMNSQLTLTLTNG